MNETPHYISSDNVSRTTGREAQRNNILAARIVAEIVKSTLGPKGMDKMLVDSSGNIIVTNDGVTILNEIEIEHPAAKMVAEIAKTQEKEVGDGTTTAVMLAGKLLERAEYLIEKKIHPTVIIKGYKKAMEKSLKFLNEISISVNSLEILKKIAVTAMTGKGAEGEKEKLSELILKAINQSSNEKDINISDIKIQKIEGGTIADSELVEGIVLNKSRANIEMPYKIRNARILLIDVPLEIRSPETETRISVSSPEQLESFIELEENYLKKITQKILESDANVVFCQKGIDDVAQYYLAKEKIFACRRVEKTDMEKLSRATSAKIISNINDISKEQLGNAEIVEELKSGDESLIFIRGCFNPKAVTLLLRGGTSHVVDEIERAVQDGLKDVISSIKSGKIVCGGGAVEVEIARRLKSYAKTLSGREQLAVEEFANSLESIPEALAENAGLDPIEILTEIKRRHEGGAIRDGLNLFNNKIEDTFKAGIVEPMKVKSQAISSASEVATMILRIDDVLVSKPKKDRKIEGQEEI